MSHSVSSGGAQVAAAGVDNFDDRFEHLGGTLGGIPTEVEEFPPGCRRAEIPLLVQRLGQRSEVEASAVRLEPEPDGRYAEIDPRHEATAIVEDLVLRNDIRQPVVPQAQGEQLLEPTFGDASLVRNRVEMSKQDAGPALTRTMQTLGGLTQPAEARPAATGVGECTANEPMIANHRSQVGKCARQIGRTDTVDGHEVALLEGNDVM